MALEWIRSLSKRVETKRSAFTIVVRVSDGCTESMFFHALRSQVLIEVPLGEFGSKYNLHYADDLLVLTMRGLKDLKTLKLILYLFESMTGLKTNFSKTCLYSSNMGELPEVTIAETLNCTVGTLPITYLGIPISGRRPRKLECEGLILKIRRYLSTWKVLHLSLGAPYSCEFGPICAPHLLDVYF